MISLEEILQKYFNLKGNMFLKEKKAYGSCCGNTDYRYMTINGEKSYSDLISLLYDIDNLVGISNINDLVDNLDELTIKEGE